MEAVTLDKANMEVQYVMDDVVFLVDPSSGEQMEAQLELFGSNRELLVPGLEVFCYLHEGAVAAGMV